MLKTAKGVVLRAEAASLWEYNGEVRRQKSSAFALLFHAGTEKAEGEKSKEEFLKASFFVEVETHLAGKFKNPADNCVSFKGRVLSKC